MPRLLAAAFLVALIVAVIIRLAFRPNRSHMSYRSAARGRHVMSRRK